MTRLQTIKYALDSKGIDGMLVSDMKNIRYLSGFTGSSGCLLLTRGKDFFFTDFRYKEQAGREVRGVEILIEKEERPKLIIETAKLTGVKTLGFESGASYAFYRALLRKGLRIKAVTHFVEDMRKTKDRLELDMIKKAIARAQDAFAEVKSFIKVGASEKKIALQLEDSLRKEGCDAVPFDIIVASGPNSSMPHAKPTDNTLKAGDLVVIDWGGEAGGYFSDMTRTFLMRGKDMAKKTEIYETVLRANMASIDLAKEGVHARMVDRAARDVIEKTGYGDFFGHGTGHGVGLDIHEFPRISMLGKETIKSGMVFTIEPGIYLPGIGGVRIEDMVVAGKRDCRVLTGIPKQLEIIG